MTNALNIAGSLDTSFGTDHNGTVRLEPLAGFTRLLDDQTLITAGIKHSTQTEYAFEAVKHDVDGYFEKELATTSLRGNGLFAAMTVQADGKYLVLWGLHSASHYDAYVTRFTREGMPDLDFAPSLNGTVPLFQTIVDDLIQKWGLKVRESDGEVFVAFRTSQYDSHIFKIAGDASKRSLPNREWRVYVPGTALHDLAFRKDGRLLVVGTHKDKAIISCYDDTGKLDPLFGTAGHVELNSADADNPLCIFSIVVDDQDRITVAGSNAKLRQTQNFVAGFTANGQPDHTFNQGAVLHSDVEDGSYVCHVVQSDGKVVVLARAQATGFTTKLVRYTRDARKDQSFGNAGVALAYTRSSGPGRAFVDTVELQHPGEKFLVSGPNANYYTYITRLLNDT
ncbi:hypothetical protein HX836_25170 [Pseudomonas yamanorum]|uniref:hypothetical protein n=1 Tax=Pseudomonas yamanorum TaxID=515393 RepID=UPI0015A0FD00|nr:hypothetical protein [Pseudomonas yamanorum]NVZ85108.1 hypothetical protein [Pseudomonas yamanorum]